jgi:hypothetical protein
MTDPIDAILATACDAHDAGRGEPCIDYNDGESDQRGYCEARIRRALAKEAEPARCSVGADGEPIHGTACPKYVPKEAEPGPTWTDNGVSFRSGLEPAGRGKMGAMGDDGDTKSAVSIDIPIDGKFHTFCIAYDGRQHTVYVDGVAVTGVQVVAGEVKP